MAESIHTYKIKYESHSTGTGAIRTIDVHREGEDNTYKDEFVLSRVIREMAEQAGGSFQVGDEFTIEYVGVLA